MSFFSPTAYLTLTRGFTHREPFFKSHPHWAAIRERLRPFRLLCLPLRKIPPSAPLVLFNDVESFGKSLDFIHKRSPDTLRLIQLEPPINTQFEYQYTPACYARFSRIYTLRDDIQGPKFQKIHYPHPLQSHPPKPQQRLLTMIADHPQFSCATNSLCTERRRVIEFFEDKPDADFTFYGTGWKYINYRTYGGPVDDKLSTLSNFRFTIAYEKGHSMPGHVTAQILDCLCAGSVPIYWGAPNITDYIPSDCFIDRTQFPSDQALYDHLLTLDPTPYLAAASRFLASKKAALFSTDRFIDQISADIQEALEA